MTAVKVRGDQEWIAQVDELGRRLGLRTRSAVLQSAVELLARGEGMELVQGVNHLSKYHSWVRPVIRRPVGEYSMPQRK